MPYRTFVSARAKIEATRGAGGTPVRILSLSDTSLPNLNREIIMPDELRSSYFPKYQAAVGNTRPELTISGNLDYSQAAWLGLVYVSGTATAAGSTSYTYSFTPSGTADDLKTAVIEIGWESLGASNPAYKLPYLGGEELTVRFDKAANEVTYQARLVGGTAASQITAYTGTPTSPTSALVTAANTQVYIDSTTIGSTSDTNVQSVEWTLSNNWKQLMTLNNTAGPTSVLRPSARTWTLRVRRYSANKNEWDAAEAGTERKIRVLATGPTLGSSAYKLTADFYGVITGRSHTFVDDLVFEELEISQYYDSTATTDFKWDVVCADATIT